MLENDLNDLTKRTPLSGIAKPESAAIAYFSGALFLCTLEGRPSLEGRYLRVFVLEPNAQTWRDAYRVDLVAEGADDDDVTPYPAAIEPSIVTAANAPASLRFDIFAPTIQRRIWTADGVEFDTVALHPGGQQQALILNDIVSLDGRLFACPGAGSASDPEAGSAIYTTTLEPDAQWTRCPLPLTQGASVCSLHADHDYLYAGVEDQIGGFQLWRGERNPQSEWSPVLEKGAYKYALNAYVFRMVSFGGDLLVATGLSESHQKRVQSLHRQGFELLRLYPDLDWDLLIGNPVFTPKGLKVPLSAIGSGIDDTYRQRIHALAAHDDRLYLATSGLSGLQVWSSDNGEEWMQLSLPAFSRESFAVESVTALVAPYVLFLLVRSVGVTGEVEYRVLSRQ